MGMIVNPYCFGSGAPGSLTASAFTEGANSGAGTTYGYTASGLTSGRKVLLLIVFGNGPNTTTRTVSTITVDGVAATAIVNPTANRFIIGAWFVVTTATSAAVSVTFSGNMDGAMLGHVELLDARLDTYSSRSGSDQTLGSSTSVTPAAISVPSGGAAISAAWGSSSGNHTWTQDGGGSPTELYDTNSVGGGGTSTVAQSTSTSATQFTATGANSGSRRALSFSWAAGPGALGITGAPTLTAVAGTAYSASFSAVNGHGSNVFSVASGPLPGGVSLNAATGVLSASVVTGDAGAYPLTIRVTDAGGVTADYSYTLTVTASPGTFTADTTAETADDTSHKADEN